MSIDLFNAYLDGEGYIVAWRDEGAALVATRDFPEVREENGALSWEIANEIAEAMNLAYRMGQRAGIGEAEATAQRVYEESLYRGPAG